MFGNHHDLMCGQTPLKLLLASKVKSLLGFIGPLIEKDSYETVRRTRFILVTEHFPGLPPSLRPLPRQEL
jgi:hypothetical protein